MLPWTHFVVPMKGNKQTKSLINFDNFVSYSYIMDLTYDVLFFKITQLLLPQDKKLGQALDSMEHLDYSQIGLPASITDARTRVRSAILVFERIGSFRTPGEKLDCLLTTVSNLTENHDSFIDSDSLIPLLLMTLIKSKVPHLTANLIYMKVNIYTVYITCTEQVLGLHV